MPWRSQLTTACRRTALRAAADAERWAAKDVPRDRMMEKYTWNRLNHLQLGRYAEYLAKMEFTLYGFGVYTAEVDDRGIDFVVRLSNSRYYDIQVKSSRSLHYIFFPKDKFDLRENLLAVVVIFVEDKDPQLYLIPSMAWSEPNALFVSRNYEGKKSKPEWGLNLSQKNLPLLAEFSFDKAVQRLLGHSKG